MMISRSRVLYSSYKAFSSSPKTCHTLGRCRFSSSEEHDTTRTVLQKIKEMAKEILFGKFRMCEPPTQKFQNCCYCGEISNTSACHECVEIYRRAIEQKIRDDGYPTIRYSVLTGRERQRMKENEIREFHKARKRVAEQNWLRSRNRLRS